MALDNAQFISELSFTDPPGTDPLSQGDDQIRTAKRAVFQSFPFIDKQVDLTADQLNLAAIKNETNVFTVRQDFGANIRIDTPDGQTRGVQWHDQLADERDFDLVYNQINATLSLRWNIAGVQQSPNVFTVDQATGIMDFGFVPTVAGAPLWIAGEIRMFVAAATPGTNWFVADGTNGTVNLDNRVLTGEGLSSPGTLLNPNLVGTAAAGTTGATAPAVPSHNHRLRGGGASGITDVTLGNVSTQTVVGANRGNTASQFFSTNSGGQDFIENTGSSSSHTHSQAAAAVTENGTSRDTVRPLSAVVQYHQYVP